MVETRKPMKSEDKFNALRENFRVEELAPGTWILNESIKEILSVKHMDRTIRAVSMFVDYLREKSCEVIQDGRKGILIQTNELYETPEEVERREKTVFVRNLVCPFTASQCKMEKCPLCCVMAEDKLMCSLKAIATVAVQAVTQITKTKDSSINKE